MHSKQLIIILVTLAVLTGAWLMFGERQPAPDDSVSGQRLFPELEQKLNDTTRIRVEHRGSVFEVVKKGDQWQLPDRGGYPVLFERVKPLLLGIAGLEKVEAKTSKPENYARLGVQEPSADSANTRIELYAGDEPVASFIVGGISSGLITGGRDGIFVRVSNDPRAWLVAGNLVPPEKPVDWVDRQIIHIKPKAVQRVTIRHPDGDTLVVEKLHKGVATYTVVNMPAGAVLKDGAETNLLARGLAGLNMEDVLVRSQAALPEAEAAAAVFKTWDGLQVTAYTVEQDDKIFIWFDVSNDDELRSRLTGWVYQIPRARGDTLRKRLDDMIVRR